MPDVINQMAWGDPILPAVADPQWEKEVKADMGFIPDLLPRVSSSIWLRNACFKWPRIPVRHFPQQLGDIASLVTAQENACRYCYGVARSHLRAFGHSEKDIARIERGMQYAELNEQQRVFIRFCRNLARSNPRPPKAERDKLIELGFSELAVTEMAFHVANHCFINRVSTFVSCAPMYQLEKMTGGLLGKLMRPLVAKKLRGLAWTDTPPLTGDIQSFPGVVQALSGVIGAAVINDGLNKVMNSEVLSQDLKVLMFAVVARSLECEFCQDESRKMAKDLGFSDRDFDQALSSLSSPKLNEQESKILAWTRETVHYDARSIQALNSQMVKVIEPSVFVEAIGTAALANSIVRLAVLLE